MVAVESDLPEWDEVFLASQRKYNLDPDRPWWQKAYFRVFLLLMRFSYKVMKVYAPGEIDKDGNIVLIEQQGVYWDEATAKATCPGGPEGEFWCVKPIPFNVALPKETVGYRGHDYPRARKPDRYLKPIVSTAPAPAQDLVEIKEAFENISRIAGA